MRSVRLLLIHCKTIGFKDIRKSNRPLGINPNGKQEQSYKDVLAVFICIENWDETIEIEQGIKTVMDHLELIKKSEIVLIPFAHLSYYLADPDKSFLIINQIASDFRKKGVLVNKSSFGYHKQLDFQISDLIAFGHPGSVAFRRFPDNIELELKNYIMEYGIENTKILVSKLSIEKTKG